MHESHEFNPVEPWKKTLAFHYTGCLIGILIMAYYSPHSHNWGSCYTLNNQGPFFRYLQGFWQKKLPTILLGLVPFTVMVTNEGFYKDDLKCHNLGGEGGTKTKVTSCLAAAKGRKTIGVYHNNLLVTGRFIPGGMAFSQNQNHTVTPLEREKEPVFLWCRNHPTWAKLKTSCLWYLLEIIHST